MNELNIPSGAAPAGEEKGGGVLLRRLQVIAHQLCSLQSAVLRGTEVTASELATLTAENQILRNEITRLQEGQFTKDEIHNFCHNLHGTVSAEEFAEGCRKEMVKLYGRCPMLSPEEALPPGWLGAPKAEWDRLEKAANRQITESITQRDTELSKSLLHAIAGIHPTPLPCYKDDIAWAVRDTVACLNKLRQDRNDAAGELGIDIKEMPPGSTLAKVVTANVLLRKDNARLLGQVHSALGLQDTPIND